MGTFGSQFLLTLGEKLGQKMVAVGSVIGKVRMEEVCPEMGTLNCQLLMNLV